MNNKDIVGCLRNNGFSFIDDEGNIRKDRPSKDDLIGFYNQFDSLVAEFSARPDAAKEILWHFKILCRRLCNSACMSTGAVPAVAVMFEFMKKCISEDKDNLEVG